MIKATLITKTMHLVRLQEVIEFPQKLILLDRSFGHYLEKEEERMRFFCHMLWLLDLFLFSIFIQLYELQKIW